MAHDVRRGLPFDTGTFDAVYHSHIIEHLHPGAARDLTQECFRVLKAGGRLRVATPDLETMVRVYLGRLEAALADVPGAAADHSWMLLELLDQMVRSRSGGDMERQLRQPALMNRDFIASRIGEEARTYWSGPAGARARPGLPTISAPGIARLVKRARQSIAVLIAGLIAGRDCRRAFQEGLFRNSGEVHLWLYDRLSLAALLEEAGFIEIRQCAAAESRLPDFAAYDLDVRNGSICKPDSLFMEAGKPPVR
jgi:hypothetical protein